MSLRPVYQFGIVIVCGMYCVANCGGTLRAEDAPEAQIDFQKDVQPFFNDYCGACHNPDDQIAGLDLEQYQSVESVTTERGTWQKILHVLNTKEMPPEDEAQPSEEQRKAITQWIDLELKSFDCTKIDNPGRVTIRRLNRVEYNNTIRDLMGVDFQPADDFPSDDVGYGFDNIGDVLSMSPLLMEKYLSAAEKIVETALWAEDPYKAPRKSFEGAEMQQDRGGRAIGKFRSLASMGEVFTEHEFAADGEYLVICEAYGKQAGPDPAKMEFRIDGKAVETVNVTAVSESPGYYEIRLPITAGKHRVGVAFINDYYQPKHEDPKLRGDRNLYICNLAIQGPIETTPQELPETHKRLVFCDLSEGEDPLKCAHAILDQFISRAFRRPATEDEIKNFMRLGYKIIEDGGTSEQALRVVFKAILISPQFLFRIEFNEASEKDEQDRVLNDYELASRLSYWLWSSMPDDELFEQAGKGELSKPLVLEAQIRRMLADPKSSALVENFAGQWLQLRSLTEAAPNKDVFSEFDDDLRLAMRRETEMFFAAAIRENLSILDFLDGKFTYVNERLAKHYGLEGVSGPEFRRVSLEGTQRAGVLTQASILTITSDPTRTSPVKRGKWILDNILASPPLPPPPDVPLLSEDADAVASGTLRQRFEIHRSNPACISCHEKMDPLGFGFENFDAIGRWRTKDSGFDVDASGTLPDGQTFNGPAELLTILKASRGEFSRCLTEKMLTYALGRGLEYYDKCAVDSICEALAKDDYKFTTMFLEIAKSDPFRNRRNSPGDKK
ncbi:hypothetical protein Pan258_42830 [Symmachiella dynata]|uniref:DUF1592 domain-containing protein n=1 Tax=Symmachiella dynata TaxID=2527995 RepID=UPI00118CF0D4|nr:DUF1592 domain-containing protein [Symmachiella dynata]QDT50226.1 hypothetical protein Pan258_42830 [Symmachiella dynata]